MQFIFFCVFINLTIKDKANLETLIQEVVKSSEIEAEIQRMVLNKLMDNFEGNPTSSKWAKVTKVSADTALRHITDLVNKGILLKAS